MRVLVACERSGIIRDAFRRRGIEAWSNDLEPPDRDSEFSRFHIIGDAVEIAYRPGWTLLIAHPPCQFLAGSGLHWNRRPGYEWRDAETEKAGQFAVALWKAPIRRKCIENPRGALKRFLGPASQRVQPPQFGDDASKETRLWLDHLPRLRPTGWRPGRLVDDGRPQLGLFGTGVERWDNQTDSGQNKLGPSADRAARRAVTYPGIAEAMAEQWGALLIAERARSS